MTVVLFWLLLRAPFWMAFIPAVLLFHRIGIMMHDYIHGSPCRRYANALRILAFFDGLMLMFGFFETFRATHLAHHRWLNGPGDPESENRFAVYADTLRGVHPYGRRSSIIASVAISLFWIGFWIAVGMPMMIVKLVVVMACTMIGPVTMRSAIEHHADPRDPGFANEYRTLIPLFNLNRHIHHHEEPRLPWYLLQFRTAHPLPWTRYFTHWYHVHVRKDFVLMHPRD